MMHGQRNIKLHFNVFIWLASIFWFSQL